MSLRLLTALKPKLAITVAIALFGCASQTTLPKWGEITVEPINHLVTKRSVTTDDLIALRDIDTISVSPNGQLVAFQLRQADPVARRYRNEWFAIYIKPGSIPIFLGDAGKPRLFQLRNNQPPGNIDQPQAVWSDDNLAFAYPITNENRETSLGFSTVSSRTQDRINDSMLALSRLNWSSDGNKIYFIGDDIEQALSDNLAQFESDTGYLYNERFVPASSTKPILEDAFDFDDPFLSRPNIEDLTGRLKVYSRHSGMISLATESDIESYMARERASDPALLAAGLNLGQAVQSKYDARTPHYASPVKFGPADAHLGWVDLARPDDIARWPDVTVHTRINDTSAELVCPFEQCTGLIRGLWGSEDGSTLYFFKTSGMNHSQSSFFKWSIRENTIDVLHSSDALFKQCQKAIDELICLYESPSEPRRIVSLSLEDGTIETVFDPNSQFSSLDLGDVERLEWTSDRGHTTFGHLIKPANYDPEKRYPLVITTYKSKGFLRGATGDEFPIYPIANEGMLVLSYNDPALAAGVYSSPDNEPRYKSYEDWYENKANLALIDTIIDQLIDDGLVDSNRLAITGISFGSMLANYAMIYSKHSFVATSISSASHSPMQYYAGGKSFQRAFQSMGLGFPNGESAENWAHIASSLNAHKIDSAVLMQIPDGEFIGSLEFITAMEANNKPIEAYVFQNEYHTKYWPQHRFATYNRNIDWMNFWLRGIEDPDPWKAHQYERWRDLREKRDAKQDVLSTSVE